MMHHRAGAKFMKEVHLTSGITFCFHRYSFWVYDIPFCFVKDLIVGLMQFNKDFHKILKGFNQPLFEFIIPNVFFKKPTKG